METFRLTLDAYESKLIHDALLRHREKEGNQLMWSFGNADFVVSKLQALSAIGRVVEFYEGDRFIGILLFDVGDLWWTDAIFLLEEFVLCVDKDYKGFQRKAIEELEFLANLYEVNGIISGCYFQAEPQIVMNGYLREGFDVNMPSAMKILRPKKPVVKE